MNPDIKLVTKRDVIKATIQRMEPVVKQSNSPRWEQCLAEVSRLNLSLVTEDVITQIVGNNSWTKMECGCCRKDCQEMVFFEQYTSDEGYSTLCRECAQAIMSKFK